MRYIFYFFYKILHITFITFSFLNFEVLKANIFHEITACLDDPCNCPRTSVTEVNNGVTNMYDGNKTCPPWNKWSGRENCLLKKPPPDKFEMFYSNFCAEASPLNSYFNQVIRVRLQACNVACWNRVEDLKSDGECTLWPGPYAVPMIRVCARIAQPERTETKSNFGEKKEIKIKADHGYTENVHLQENGDIVSDPKFKLHNGTYQSMTLPKICAYEDPFAGQFIEGTPDIFDYDPYRQPFHYTEGVHPIITVIKALIDQGMSISDILADDIIGKAFSLSNMLYAKIAVSFIAKGVNFLGEEVFKKALDNIGKLNAYVKSSLGCVELKYGPLPPPFCKDIKTCLDNITPIPEIEMICPTIWNNENKKKILYPPKVDGKQENTDDIERSENSCIYDSRVENSFINNSFRVSYDIPVSICSRDQNPELDNCALLLKPCDNETDTYCSKVDFEKPVTICKNDQNPQSHNCIDYGMHTQQPDIIHNIINDLVPLCPVTKHGICAYVSIKPSDDTSKEYRIIHGFKMNGDNNQSYPLKSYDPSINVCSLDSKKNICSEIYGINIGDHKNITFLTNESYNYDQNDNRVIESKKDFILKDQNKDYNYKSKIILKNWSGTNQSLGEICIYDKTENNLYGCIKRAPSPRPLIKECSIENGCSSNILNPSMLVSIPGGENSVTKLTSVKDYQIHNIAGLEYKTYATDNGLTKMPFPLDNPRSIEPSSLLGIYKPKIDKYNFKKIIKSKKQLTYLNGLEYSRGIYSTGGQIQCIDSEIDSGCEKNEKYCILSKLENSDIVDCNWFKENILNKFDGIGPCLENELNHNPKSFKIFYGKEKNQYISIYTLSSNNYIKKCYTYPKMGTNLNQYNSTLCSVSNKIQDRIDPPYDSSNLYLTDEQYYKRSEKMINGRDNFDTSKYGIRNKNHIELGLCTSIPEPKCKASKSDGLTTETSEERGFAEWEESSYGNKISGICQKGYYQSSKKNPTRYCLLDKNTGTASFGKVKGACKSLENSSCPSIKKNHILWKSVLYGEKSAPVLDQGFILNNKDQDISRKCIFDDSKLKFRLEDIDEEKIKTTYINPLKFNISSKYKDLKKYIINKKNDLNEIILIDTKDDLINNFSYEINFYLKKSDLDNLSLIIEQVPSNSDLIIYNSEDIDKRYQSLYKQLNKLDKLEFSKSDLRSLFKEGDNKIIFKRNISKDKSDSKNKSKLKLIFKY